MVANYHTHTPRCNHAQGTEEEYVQAALKGALKILGFSDHTPYIFPEGYYSSFRMKPGQLKDYTESVLNLRDRYKDQIEIHCGVEAEYYPLYFSDSLAFLRDSPVEYMILGQHFVGNEIHEPASSASTDSEEILSRYCRQTMEALNTGLYTYFAHPDLIRFTGDRKVYAKHIRQLCREAKSCRIPLEINLLGVHESRHYPYDYFWELAAEEGCQVIIGCDAHQPFALQNVEAEKKGMDLARRYGLEVLETVTLRHI